MRRTLNQIFKFFDNIAATCVILLVLLTAQQVIWRYLFNDSSIAMQELQWHFFSAIFLLASASCFRKNAQVRVDIFYQKFSKQTQNWIDRLGILLFLTPCMLLLSYYGLEFVEQSRSFVSETHSSWWLQGERSPNPGGLPARWIVKSLILVMAISTLLVGLEKLIWINDD